MLHTVVDTGDGREVVMPECGIEAGDRIGYDAFTGLYTDILKSKSGNYYDAFSELWVNVIHKE